MDLLDDVPALLAIIADCGMKRHEVNLYIWIIYNLWSIWIILMKQYGCAQTGGVSFAIDNMVWTKSDFHIFGCIISVSIYIYTHYMQHFPSHTIAISMIPLIQHHGKHWYRTLLVYNTIGIQWFQEYNIMENIEENDGTKLAIFTQQSHRDSMISVL